MVLFWCVLWFSSCVFACFLLLSRFFVCWVLMVYVFIGRVIFSSGDSYRKKALFGILLNINHY